MTSLPDSKCLKLCGTALSPGVVIGTAYQAEPYSPSFYRIRIAREEVTHELNRFREAVTGSRSQLLGIKEKLGALVGKEYSYIVDVHLLILADGRFLEQIEERIERGLASPERAIRETADEWLSVFRSLDDPFFQERGSELKDVEDRLLANLTEVNGQDNQAVPDGLILVAPEVSLSLLADYRLERIKGLVLRNAGRASHVTIIARSYQIPVVSGIDNISRCIRTGDTLIVDGGEGVVYRNPGRKEMRRYELRVRYSESCEENTGEDQAPCRTADGRPVSLYLNTEIASEVVAGLKQGAEGVGLFRSEFMFMKRQTALMSEDEQLENYKELAQAAGKKPVVLRTLDIGEGRHPFFAVDASVDNASLGLRGIRLSFKYPDIFRSQLRAILRAGPYGNLKIVFPMVSSADEMIQGRQIVRGVQEELEREGFPVGAPLEVGVMIEVPAAVLTLDSILAHADFAAVGTNDLIQYTLAAGRTNDQVAYLFNPLHPAVLSSLKMIMEVSARREKKTFVCGEITSHPLYVYVLLGLGFQHLSMHPTGIPAVKRAIRRIRYLEAKRTVEQMLTLPTIEAVTRFVADNLGSWERPQETVEITAASLPHT